MIIFKKADELTEWLSEQRKAGRKIGFVPTMGALHAGHMSLIDMSKKTTQLTVTSIFVNPTQFNDPRDFQKYPITIENDIYILEKAGTDVLFLPAVDEMYPQGMAGLEKYELGPLETILEGRFRPGHFQGVCQVVRRLLDMVQPDDLFMGQKDYQQCMVVRRLLEIMQSGARLQVCPIIREPDGLAMSSRNMRLTEEERKKATVIYKALSLIREQWRAQDLPEHVNELWMKATMDGVMNRARTILIENGFRIDYVEIADAVTLQPVSSDGPHRKFVALAAAFQGEIRLIDNMVL